MTTAFIGQPIRRVDGRQKVTGGAPYAAEFDVPNVAHGAIVRSAVPSGRITTIDTAAAERAPGVIAVVTQRNAPRLAYRAHKGMVDPVVGERLHVLQDDRISHQGQPIALVIAGTLEQANHAASLVRIGYAEEAATTDVTRARPVMPRQQQTDQGARRPPETRRGDPEGALATAAVKVDQTYVIPREHHNPIELHATIAAWDGDRLTLWDKSQWVYNTAEEIAAVFGIAAQDVRVISPFVGGAFGSSLRTWPHVTLAALGARVAKRPVKLMLSRREMYYGVGFRPHTIQRIALGASRDARLAAIVHDAHRETSAYEEYSEALLEASRFLYFVPERVHAPPRRPHERQHADLHACPWRGQRQLRVRMCDGRARRGAEHRPRGASPSQRAEDRRVQELPFSSRSTSECYRVAAERCGWSRRDPRPRSMRDGRSLIGWGMATANYPMNFAPASAKARLLPDGTAEVTSAASDMGPGTWTSMTQVAAETLGLPIERREVYARRYAAPARAGARWLDDHGERRQRRSGRVPQGA